MIQSLPNEEWRLIDGHPNYMISNLGRVKSLERITNVFGGVIQYSPEILRKLHIDRHGYASVIIKVGSRYRHLSISRAVALAFVENPRKLNEVNHKDKDKLNNKSTNLEYCTHAENIRHAITIGRPQ